MWLFFGVALVLYLPGIWWGLPAGVLGRDKPWGTDELGAVGAINEVYGVFAANKPSFNPQYPLWHYLCQLVFVAPYYGGLWLTGHLSSPAPIFPYGLDHPATELRMLTLLARLPSLLMAAGVVALAFRTGEILRDRTVGILTACFVMLQYSMFYYARTSNVDMAALFWTALGLLVFAHVLASGAAIRSGMALGAAAALATAAKDASYAVFVPVGAIFLVLHVRAMRRAGATWIETLRAPAAALLTAVLVYAVASGLVFRPRRWQLHVRYITTHGGSGDGFYYRHPATLDGYLSLALEIGQSLVDAMGLPMLVAAGAGVVYWLMRRRDLLLWAIPAAGIPVLVLLPVRFSLLRFVLIPAYMLALPAADLLVRGLQQPTAARQLSRLALVVVLVWSAIRGADITVQMLHDSRYAGATWLLTTARPGDRIGHIVPASNLPRLPEGVRTALLKPGEIVSLSHDARPEFLVLMALDDTNPVHERQLPEETYQGLLDGTLGYRQAALLQGPSLFSHRPASYLNPPLRIFIRSDLVNRLAGR